MIVYQCAEGVQATKLRDRPLFTTIQGGRVAADDRLVSLWEYAGGRTLAEILATFPGEGSSPDTIRAGLACLAEAGLLLRDSMVEPQEVIEGRGPLVSAVVVSFNSREWLSECLPSLFNQTYSPLEVVIVENGSDDGAADWVAENYPEAVLLQLAETQSFARATNLGVEAAKGDFLYLVNPDVRLEPDVVARLVATAQANPGCAAVGAKLKFWWAPAFLNGLGNRVGPFSWGTDNGLGHLDLGQFDRWQELPSACYASVLISRPAWEAVGPADEGFPMYYEDSEWSYRARLLGYKVCAAPGAVVYHAFGGRVPGGEEAGLSPGKLRNVVFGRLRFALKLTGRSLGRFLRNYLLEDWTNFWRAVLKRQWPTSRAYLGGWSDVLNNLPGIFEARRSLQSRRVIPDEDLFALQRDMPETLAWHGLPELSWDIVQNHYLPLILSRRTKRMPEFDPSERRPHLLVVSHDVVDVKLAGPGMRYLEMARALSADLDVTLAVPSETSLDIPGLRLVRYWEDRPGSLQVLAENSDVVLVSGYMVEKFPFLAYTRARVVVDLYDPFVLENLHYYLHEPVEAQEHLNEHAVAITNHLAQIGDFYICGNDRQRDYWMGVLTANGRTNPRNFIQDPTLFQLIDIVGIGFPNREPVGKPLFRGAHPQLSEEARIVLWGGGIWNWLDPLTLVQAWPQVLARHPEARLVFLGTRHPNPLVPRHEMAAKAERLAGEIGEKDRSILFFEWLSYEDREALLCESDVGVTLHPIHVETRFSLRTRVLDYLWARLPVLITDGDVTSEWVREYGIGVVVPPFDAQAVGRGLIEILDQPKASWAPAFEPLRASLEWNQVVKPLLRYCLEGDYAPDRLDRQAPEPPPADSPAGRLARARNIWRTEGTRVLLHRAWRYLQWRLSRP
jgi:glycosyltransferase involved in cell wall biosynthesis